MKRCGFDWLSAYNGPTNTSDAIFGPVCGNLNGNPIGFQTDVQTTFKTSSPQILVEFYTDNDISLTGFEIEFSQEG